MNGLQYKQIRLFLRIFDIFKISRLAAASSLCLKRQVEKHVELGLSCVRQGEGRIVCGNVGKDIIFLTSILFVHVSQVSNSKEKQHKASCTLLEPLDNTLESMPTTIRKRPFWSISAAFFLAAWSSCSPSSGSGICGRAEATSPHRLFHPSVSSLNRKYALPRGAFVRGGSTLEEEEQYDEEEYDSEEEDDDVVTDDEEDADEEQIETKVETFEDPLFPSPVMNLYCTFGVMYLGRKVDLLSPTMVRVARFAFIAVLQSKIGGADSNQMMKNLASSLLSSKSTVAEYDVKQARAMQQGLLFNLAFMWFLHFKMNQVQPVLVSAISGIINIFYSPLFQAYVLGRNLERPFKSLVEARAEQANAGVDDEKEEEENEEGDTEDEDSETETSDEDEAVEEDEEDEAGSENETAPEDEE